MTELKRKRENDQVFLVESVMDYEGSWHQGLFDSLEKAYEYIRDILQRKKDSYFYNQVTYQVTLFTINEPKQKPIIYDYNIETQKLSPRQF